MNKTVVFVHRDVAVSPDFWGHNVERASCRVLWDGNRRLDRVHERSHLVFSRAEEPPDSKEFFSTTMDLGQQIRALTKNTAALAITCCLRETEIQRKREKLSNSREKLRSIRKRRIKKKDEKGGEKKEAKDRHEPIESRLTQKEARITFCVFLSDLLFSLLVVSPEDMQNTFS